MHSFRLKLALLSGLITAALLIGSGVLLWRLTYQFNLDRLDREIRNLGQANLDRVLGRSHWVRLEGALAFVAGDERTPGYVLWVGDGEHVVYQSPRWPVTLNPATLPPLTAYEPGAPAYLPGQALPPPPRRDQAISKDNPPLPRKVPRFFTVTVDGHPWRVGLMGNAYTTLALGADLDEFNASLRHLRTVYLGTLLGTFILVIGGAWFLAERALRPVDLLTRAVEGITARGLDQRLAAPAHDREFQRLITVFNAMMDRLEKSFHQATRFSADASHELKTPLALLQAELEQTLQAAPVGSPQQQACTSMLEEIHHLKAIVQKLLLLSLADAGRLELHREPTDLGALLENIVEDCRALAAADVTIAAQLATGVRVAADADLLEQALQNLAGNALKYNQPGGRIEFSLATSASHALVRIANTGPGIAAADRGRIFERFFRADPSRNRRVSGAGLGLSLAREIVRAHDGDITHVDAPAGLTTFEVRLPLATERCSGRPAEREK